MFFVGGGGGVLTKIINSSLDFRAKVRSTPCQTPDQKRTEDVSVARGQGLPVMVPFSPVDTNDSDCTRSQLFDGNMLFPKFFTNLFHFYVQYSATGII